MKPKLTNSAKYKCLEHLKKNSYDLYLTYCGIEECDPGHSYGPTTRDEYLLHYVIDGKGTFHVHDEIHHLEKHDAFIIYPSEETYYEADHDDPWTYLWIGFDGIKAETSLINASFSREKRVNRFTCEKTLMECVQGMLNASHLTYANDLKREGYLYLFLSAINQEKYDDKSKDQDVYDYPHHIYVDQAIDFIKENYEKNIKINDIANYIGINRSYLTTVFKKTLQVPPQKYLVKFRLEKAAILLTRTSLLIQDVAYRVGYDNPLTFSKVFKNFYGVSPSLYRGENLTSSTNDEDLKIIN